MLETEQINRKIVFGKYDSPQEQKQPPFYVDIMKTNVAIFGGTMSGKTTMIKNILVRLQEKVIPNQLNELVYILDFGGNIGDFGNLGCVCACFDNSNEENVKRIFRTVEKRLHENVIMLKNNNFYNFVNNPETVGKRPPHITLIIENLNAFLSEEQYMSYNDVLMKLCRDGISKGLSVIFTASDTSAGVGRFMANFGQKIAFDLPSDKYMEIFNGRVLQPMKIPGRGVANIGSVVYEFQGLLPFANENKELKDFIEETFLKYTKENLPEKLKGFDQELTKENYKDYVFDGSEYYNSDLNAITVGLDYYEHMPVKLNIKDMRSIAIYGKKKFGKTNLLSLIVQQLYKNHPEYRFVLFDDGRKQLENIKKIFSVQTDMVDINGLENLKKFLVEEGYYTKIAGAPGVKPPMPPSRPPVRQPMGVSVPGSPVSVPRPETGASQERPVEKKNPFTVFIIQSKFIYQSSSEATMMTNKIFPEMIAKAEEKGYLFIFSDVQRISDRAVEISFNNSISVAFLLDSIGNFVADKGSKSVFGEMDSRELKTEYAKCEIGDGYFYDIESDMLKKLKFIKQE